jgi:hypothetical protein
MTRQTEEQRFEKQICMNSIERVINTTIRILERSAHEDAGMNLDDWLDLKQVTVKIWNEERNRIFIRNMEKKNDQANGK